MDKYNNINAILHRILEGCSQTLGALHEGNYEMLSWEGVAITAAMGISFLLFLLLLAKMKLLGPICKILFVILLFGIFKFVAYAIKESMRSV